MVGAESIECKKEKKSTNINLDTVLVQILRDELGNGVGSCHRKFRGFDDDTVAGGKRT